MDISALTEPLDDQPFFDIMHGIDVIPMLRALIDGCQRYVDVELMHVVTQETRWVRVTPTLWRASRDHESIWLIEDAHCQRLDDHGTPVGPIGSCNGYFTTVETPGHTIGKLDVNIPDEQE